MSDKKFDLSKLNDFVSGSLYSELKEDLHLRKRIMEEQGQCHTRQLTEEEKKKYGIDEYKNTTRKETKE